MGYNMSQMSCDSFLLKKENFAAALKAVKDLTTRQYTWVNNDEVTKATTLKDAISAWNWELTVDDEGNGTSLDFNAEKLGDEEAMFNAIAPFVESGMLEMKGEVGDHWRWLFKDGKCRNVSGRVVYDE
jgi:Golgi nucleoside diphosphatase